MLKRYMLLFAALVFAVGAHLRPCCEVEIGGLPAASGLSPRAVSLAVRCAGDAAEEILREGARLPEVRRRTRLRFSRPSGDAGALTDALLRATEGVARRDEVRVNGVRLGWVADGQALREALRGYIADTLPTWASGGVISAELGIRRLYTRDGYLTAQGDMLLLITGAAPVFYYDQTGRYARA